MGSPPDQWPDKRGFDRIFGIPHGGGVYFFPIRRGRDITLDGEPAPVDTAEFYTTDAFNDYAVQFIQDHVEATSNTSRQPFFLYVPHIAPHFPMQAKEEDIQGSFKKSYIFLKGTDSSEKELMPNLSIQTHQEVNPF